jgi:sugar/nucleoside kinase (ribokinase family)
VRLDHNSLSEQLLHAQAFHFVCSGERCQALVDGILDRRAADQSQNRTKPERPLFVWEPLPDLYIPEEIDKFKQAISQVDVVSPNSEELANFFVEGAKSQADIAAEVLDWGIGPSENGILIVREGKNGCSAFSRGDQIHIRAYHTPAQESQSKVIDPTGGGNAFLGALSMAFTGDISPQSAEVEQLLELDKHLSREPFLNLITSLIYATVAASYVIEQPGMPTYDVREDGSETWNGEGFGERLRTYLHREKAYLTEQISK